MCLTLMLPSCRSHLPIRIWVRRRSAADSSGLSTRGRPRGRSPSLSEEVALRARFLRGEVVVSILKVLDLLIQVELITSALG